MRIKYVNFKSWLTSLLVSFCRINSVCRRFRELKKMGCFFLLVRSSISHTYAWAVSCWATSSRHALFPYIWDILILSVSLCSVCTPLLPCLQHTRKSLVEEGWKVCSIRNCHIWGAHTEDVLGFLYFRLWQSVNRSTRTNSKGYVISSLKLKTD
jgi:hypothetical protein